MTSWLRASILLGAAPLLLGALLFILWVQLRWDGLATAGLFTIVGGVVSVGVGLVCLFFHATAPPARRSRRTTLASAALLLVNFPVAATFVFAADKIQSRCRVTVVNDSSEPIDRFRLHGAGIHVDLSAIPAGAEKRASFHVRREGELLFAAHTRHGTLEGVVDGYVVPDFGRKYLIVIGRDGRVSVR